MNIYTVKEFAKMVRLTEKTIRDWDANGTLKANRKINGNLYYTDEHYKKVMGIEDGKTQ